MIEKFYKYIDDVTSGKQITGKYARLAVERHLKDVERSKEDDFPYFFCEDTANRYIGFVHILKHVKGKYASMGATIDWSDFHCFLFGCIFGWKRKEDNYRRFTTSYLKMARKNAKTTFAVAVSEAMLMLDKEYGAEVYWTATKKDQADIGWSMQKATKNKLKKDSKLVNKLWKTNSIRIYCERTNSFVAKLGRDSDKEDGANPHLGIIDEYHAHPTDDMRNVLESGMGSREQPHILIITTAGYNIHGVCHQYEGICKDILDNKLSNDNVFVCISDLDKGDNWEDEETWIKANPMIGITPTWKYMRDQYKKAKLQGGTKIVDFQTKNLNMWVGSAEVWLDDESWMGNGFEFKEETLKGCKCYAGLDLASVRDITALVLLFPPTEENNKFTVIRRFFVPEENAIERSKKDRIPYVNWVDSGDLIATPGNVTDYDYVYNEFENLANKYEIASVAYDKWNAVELATRMELAGFNMKAFPQTTTYFNEPLKEIEKLVAKKQLNHGNCPVLRWMNGNVQIWRDGNGNMKILKKDNIKKVDGMVALAMAVGEYLDKHPRNINQDFEVIWI